MSDRKLTQTEEFILKEFFEGKSVTALVRDYLLIHDVTRKQAEKIIYDCLNKGVLTY